MYVLVVSAKVKPEQRARFLEAIEDDSEHYARWRQAADVCLSEPLDATHTAMVVTRTDRG
jgi:hypothetical protein